MITCTCLMMLVFMASLSLGAAATCYVDLDDKPADTSHSCYERNYTKMRGGVAYDCTSAHDHCCADENTCCNAAAVGKEGQEAPSVANSTTCLEDESANEHHPNCGFKMVCCSGMSPPVVGMCHGSSARTFHFELVIPVFVVFTVGIIALGIGLFCCYANKVCCWQSTPAQPGIVYPATVWPVNSVPVVVPEGVSAGQTFEVSTANGLLRVVLPSGVGPGQMFHVELPQNAPQAVVVGQPVITSTPATPMREKGDPL